MRSRTDGIITMSRGFSRGKQVIRPPMQEIAGEFVYSIHQTMKKDGNGKL